MKNKRKHAIGLLMSIMGLIVLIVNALDYLLQWNQFSGAWTAIGLVLVVIGGGLVRNNRNDKPEQPKP